MPIRLLRYMLRVWDSWLRDRPGKHKLPAIIPLVLYHGEKAWTHPRQFSELIDLPPGALEAVRAHLPRFEFILDDLSQQADELLSVRSGTPLGRVSLVLSMNWRPPEHLQQRGLGSDPFVCLMGRDHPLAKGRLTLKRYAAAMHVLVAPLGHGQGVVDLELQKLGLNRTVCASVPSFSMITQELLRDARITTVPSSVGERLADRGPFVVKRPPLELPTSNYFAFWHPRFSADPRLRWVLDAVMDAFGRT